MESDDGGGRGRHLRAAKMQYRLARGARHRGGIAGIQAALDLAMRAIRFYLVNGRRPSRQDGPARQDVPDDGL